MWEDFRSNSELRLASATSPGATDPRRPDPFVTLFGSDAETASADGGASGRLFGRLPAIGLLLAGGLLLRLVIAFLLAPGQGLSIDLANFDNWARTLADHGPGGFYQHAEFAAYPPGYLYVLWPIGIVGRWLAPALGASEYDTVFALLKLPAMLADVGIGFILFRAARRWFGVRPGLVAAALYLFVPATWYESALWGQVDSVGMLVLLGGLLLLLEGWSEWSLALLVFAIVIKPQYSLGLIVAAPILLRRHLLVPGSGPVPDPRGWRARFDRALRGLFTRRQGPIRLVSSGAVAGLTLAIVLLPWDIWLYASPSLAGIPGVGQVAGFLGLLSARAGDYPVLTANAFNAWALVGPIPLFNELSRSLTWGFDSIPVIGSIPAVAVGAGLLAAVGGLIVLALLLRDNRATILSGASVLAFAIFALPTRVHERYQFPVFVVFALLVAGSTLAARRWRWWYLLAGLFATVNLHAIATLNRPTFASPGLVGAPLGDLFRSEWVVIGVSIANTLLFGVLLATWLRQVAWPSYRGAVAGLLRRRPAWWVDTPLQAFVEPPAAEQQVPSPGEPGMADEAGRTRRLPALARRSTRLLGILLHPFRARLESGPAPVDLTASLETETGGRLDRRDLLVMLVILVVTLGVRTYRIDQPRHMYFDELYYASTATEFLQDWRYGLKTNIFEYTHPHLSKYVQAVSLAAFGNDRITGQGSVGAPVRDAAFDPAYQDPGAPGEYGGDRLAVATGTGVRIAPHASWVSPIDVSLAGAGAIAFDPGTHRLYIGTDDGSLWMLEPSAMQAAANGGGIPQPSRLGQMGGQARRLVPISGERLVAVIGEGGLVLLDGTNGQTLATAVVPSLSALVPFLVSGQPELAATVPDGLVRLDGTTLQELSHISLPSAPVDLTLVEGSDFAWRNQDMLAVPTLYVALRSKQLEAVQLGSDGSLQPFQTIAMPGAVEQVRWDRATNMVHVLGQTRDGRPTIYVVQPNVNSVFADAALPFQPAAWVLDAQPTTPSLDRQQALAFSKSGAIAYVDMGSHAWAWRIPGLIAGTLTAVLMYLLARFLFRRRQVAVLLAIVMALDSLFFIQGRIAMNDSLLGFFIVAALTLLVALFRAPMRGVGAWLAPLVGLPTAGILLGLALSTKWVGAYAIGAAVLIVLARTQPGRWIALAGLVLGTGILGFQALAGQPPNYVFWVLMVSLTTLVGAIIVGLRSRDPSSGSGRGEPAWVDPRRRFGIPFALAMLSLLVIPIGVYVVSYIPWTLALIGDPQLVPGWPPGHTGQTFLDLQSIMYHYHNDLRIPHAAGSPWWAWPFALKPVWGYLDGYTDGSQALMLITANPFLVWLGVPAAAFGAWQAWRRRSMSLAIVVIALLSLWLPWARVDRVAFNYHWYTILPFVYLLLAYLLADLWDGPSRRTWILARVAVAVALLLPALMWLAKDALCAVAGVNLIHPGSEACARSIGDVAVPVGAWLVGSLAAGWLILGMRNPRRLVAIVVGVAAVVFLVLYPAVSAFPIPATWPLIYQGLLPSWDISFQFDFNRLPVGSIPLFGIGSALMSVAVAGMAWWMMRAVAGRPMNPAGPRATTETEVAPVAGSSTQDAGWSRPQIPRPWSRASAGVTIGREILVDRWVIPLTLFVLTAIAYAVVNHGRPAKLDYFVPLADALVHGQLGLSAAFSWLGEVVYGSNGLYNVVFPPAPAVLLAAPVLLFGTGFPQAWASILLGAANVAIMSMILARMGTSRGMRVALSAAFAFGTIAWFSAQIGTGWHFAHVSAIFLTLLAILACQRNARTWVIGLLFAGAVLSRLSMLGAAPFFIAYLAQRAQRGALDGQAAFGARGSAMATMGAVDLRAYLRLAWPLAIGLAIPLGLYLVYNAMRFGSPLENGYALIPGLSEAPAFANGLASFAAIPGNLFALILAPPAGANALPFVTPPRIVSISLLLTTPFLLWSLRARDHDWFTIGAWASVALILVPTLLRADPGGVQFGFRYAQDLLPFLFLLAVRGLRGQIGTLGWGAIGIGFAVNLWGMAYAFSGWWS